MKTAKGADLDAALAKQVDYICKNYATAWIQDKMILRLLGALSLLLILRVQEDSGKP